MEKERMGLLSDDEFEDALFEMMDEDRVNEELEPFLDIIRAYNALEKTVRPNVERIKEFLISFDKISELIKANDETATISVERYEEVAPECIFVIVDTTDVSLISTASFIDAMHYSDSFNICPLMSGRLRFGIKFNDVLTVAIKNQKP